MPNDISTYEDHAEQHRAHAVNALSALAERFAPSKLGKDAVAQGGDLAERLGRGALQEVKRNPAGLALIGVGAAVILAGMGRKTPPPAMQGTEAERIAAADRRIAAKHRIEAAQTAPNANAMRSAIDKGLDHLPPSARKRVTDLRLQAVDAQDALERHTRRVSAQAKLAHQERPFATALAVAGIGGLIGALLPSTRTEGALLGAKRDQMMREAEAVLRHEVAALEQRGTQAVEAGAQAAKASFDAHAPR